MPMLAVEDAVAEVEHAAAIGLKLLSLPTAVPPTMDDGLADDVRLRITRGAFEELFPHISSPPGG